MVFQPHGLQGAHDVILKKGEFVDAARGDRRVPYKIYMPDAPDLERIPVVLWSHGFGGSRDGASFLSRFLASHGIMMVHMTHVGTDTSLWEGKPGHPWDILRKAKVSRATTLNRFVDVPFVIDQLHHWRAEHLEIVAGMDLDGIGMSGHSFGALSTQVASGQMFPDENDVYRSYADARIVAGISYSPVPIDHLGPDDAKDMIAPQDIYGSIDRPMMYMTGTEDSSPIGGAPYTHRRVVFDHTAHDEAYWLVKNGGDHMVYNGTRGKLSNNDHRERHEQLIQVFSLAFWSAYLLGDVAAKEWLQKAPAQAFLQDDGMFTFGA